MPGYAQYKNEILVQYQNALTACGIPRSDQKLYVQQVTQENGALNPRLTGGTDLGYSYGIGQWNVYPMRSATFLKLHPQEAQIEVQIQKLAKGSCDTYQLFNGNVRRSIVYHNCPSCALSNAKPSVCKGVDAWHKKTRTCYFDNEVNSQKHADLFSSGTM